jgi:subtilase family serine protease
LGTLRRYPWVERLETRDLLSAGVATPASLLKAAAGHSTLSTPYPAGYSPAQIRHAYGFDQINFGNVPGDGTGTTIAIVDAFDNPNIAEDLRQFDLAFQLPDPLFTKVNQDGGTKLPAANPGWAAEIALDVEWSHAIAPGAGILLVETYDNSLDNLLAGVSFAANYPGVVAVSMSWVSDEISSETLWDGYFTTPSGHDGVTFLASSGDTGAPANYPATSPNVVSVGGTNLRLDPQNNIASERAWSGSGGGLSPYEAQPAYQKGIVTQNSTARANPDVAIAADPRVGFPVRDTYNNSPSAPWSRAGGTSVAAPQWAALVAIADQGRALGGKPALDGPTQTLPMLYSLPSDFHDITSGTSRGTPSYAAAAGYDLATGLGTPIANQLVNDLVDPPSTTSGVHFIISTPTNVAAGAPFDITIMVVDGSGNVITDYTGTIHFLSSDGTASLPTDYTFTLDDHGSHTFLAAEGSGVTLNAAGKQTLMVVDTANGQVNGSTSVNVTGSNGNTNSSGSNSSARTALLAAAAGLVPGYVGTGIANTQLPLTVLPGSVPAPAGAGAAVLFLGNSSSGNGSFNPGTGGDLVPEDGTAEDKSKPANPPKDTGAPAVNPLVTVPAQAIAGPVLKIQGDLPAWREVSEACFAGDAGTADSTAALPADVADDEGGQGKLAVAAVLATALGGVWAPFVERKNRSRQFPALN